ncbi:EAL domain-containing protein [Arthrobacter sp. ISL-28]|nr:EAL domain-containing protein [Arthrobacter sp. ISL-28]
MRLTVNDAGSDAASMRHVRSLRPDFIKLDRSLIAGIERECRLQDLVADMVEFGRLTGAGLIAVGIETEAELATATRLGVKAGQGYHLGRPTIHPRDWSKWTARATQTVSPL